MNLVTMVVEQSEVKEVMIFFRLLKERIIFITGPTNDLLQFGVCPVIVFRILIKDKDIYMYIHPAAVV